MWEGILHAAEAEAQLRGCDRAVRAYDQRGSGSAPAKGLASGDGPHTGIPRPDLRGRGNRPVVGYGIASTCAPTAFDHALPAVASQLVDQVIAPRRSGYVFEGLKEPQLVALVRQSRAALTTDGET